MSSYNAKWLGLYILYMLIVISLYVEGGLLEKEDLFYALVFWPIFIYLIWPLFLKKLGYLKILKWLDNMIDAWYHTIKERF